MLYRAARECNVPLPPAWHDILLSAELTARVRHGNLIDTTAEVIDACDGLSVPVTLLKGISASDQYYPVPHERPMGDIDVLVPESARARVEDTLLRHGFKPSGFEMDPGSCHGSPLRDTERQVVVEVHTALFPEEDALQRNRLFSASGIVARSVRSTFHGRVVHRLAPELQLAYIASYWIRDLSCNRMHLSHLPPLLDAIHLLRQSGPSLEWASLLEWLDNEMAAVSLTILLSFLARSALDASAVPFLGEIAARQRIVDHRDLRMIHALLDTCLIRGKPAHRRYDRWRGTVVLRAMETLLTPGSHAAKLLRVPWNVAFPPLEPERYRFRFHWDRFARALRGYDASTRRLRDDSE